MSDERESVLSEAERLVHGMRRLEAAHPLDDFTATVGILNALGFRRHMDPAPQSPVRKLKPDDWPVILIALKLARLWHAYKRDHPVDIAGYAECLDWLRAEREARLPPGPGIY